MDADMSMHMAEPATSPAAPVRAAAAPIRLVIFDFDGTLSDSGDWFLSVVDELSRKFKFRTVSPEEVETLRNRTSREVIDSLGIPKWKMPLIARYVAGWCRAVRARSSCFRARRTCSRNSRRTACGSRW
jgi:hypothetical protein